MARTYYIYKSALSAQTMNKYRKEISGSYLVLSHLIRSHLIAFFISLSIRALILSLSPCGLPLGTLPFVAFPFGFSDYPCVDNALV